MQLFVDQSCVVDESGEWIRKGLLPVVNTLRVVMRIMNVLPCSVVMRGYLGPGAYWPLIRCTQRGTKVVRVCMLQDMVLLMTRGALLGLCLGG